MSQRLRLSLRAAVAALPLGCTLAGASAAQDLISFAVVSGETITNTGPTTITGNIALSPGTAFTGSTQVTLTETENAVYLTDAVAGRIKNDLATLYNVLAARPTSAMGDLTGQALGNRTLVAGVYNYATSANLAGGETLTLDGGGDPDALFIINIGTTLTAGSASRIVLTNEAQGGNVFFRVGTSATINTTAALVGQILALDSITLNTSATVNCGAVLARNGAVTLDTNTIEVCTLAAAEFDPTPEEGAFSDNESAVAGALSDYVTDGGELPTSFAILAATQSGDELAATLSQLSGEVATGVAPTVMQSMDDFLDTVLRSTRQPFAPAVPSDPGVPVGWVPEKINAAYSSKYDREAPAAAPTFAYAAAEPRNWDMWLSGYGSRNVIDGDASTGSGELTANNRGVAAGLVYSPGDGASFGLSLSSAKSDFDIADGAGSGESDSLFLALSARKAMDAFYVEGALAFGRSDISTDRTVTVAGEDRFTGEATADSVAAHVEAGYRIGRFTPFAGLRAQSIKTPAYSETLRSGTDTFGLRYEAETRRSLRSELGVAFEWPAGASNRPTLGLRAAWAHEFEEGDASERFFLTIPDVSFPVSGATRDRDALLLSASIGMAAGNGVYIDGTVNGEYSGNSSDLSGSLRIGYQW